MAQNMLKSWSPRIAEHTFKYSDNFGTDVRFAARIADFKRVKGDWISSVGRVEIDNVLDAGFGNKS